MLYGIAYTEDVLVADAKERILEAALAAQELIMILCDVAVTVRNAWI